MKKQTRKLISILMVLITVLPTVFFFWKEKEQSIHIVIKDNPDVPQSEYQFPNKKYSFIGAISTTATVVTDFMHRIKW